MQTIKNKFLVLITIICLTLAEPISAASYYFTNGSTPVGDVSVVGNWSLNASGTTPASGLPGNSDDVFFTGASQVPTVGGPITVNSATFSAGAFNNIAITTLATTTIQNGYNDKGLLGVKKYDTNALYSTATDPAPTDADVTAFIARANVTDPVAIDQLKKFTALMKAEAPTLWSRLVLIPTRSNQGYLQPYGGGVALFPSTTTPFTEGGTVTEDTTGASIAYAGNWPNRIQTPFVYNNVRAAMEPWFIGIVANNNPAATSTMFAGAAHHIGWNAGTTSGWLDSYNGGDSLTPAWQVSAGVQGAGGAQYRFDNQFVSYSRLPYLVGVAMKEGVQSISSIINDQVLTATSSAATPSTNATTPLWFYPHLTTATAPSGKMQYIVFIEGGVSDIPNEAKNFWSILRTTMMSDITSSLNDKYFDIHQNGQSNSDGNTPRLNNLRLNEYGANANYSATSIGGVYISEWLGTDSNNATRTASYKSSIYDSGVATGTMEASVLPGTSAIKRVRIFDWRHGESDTQTAPEALVYKKQLNNMFNFIKQDFGSSTKMGVMGIDYSLSYRTDTIQGNFTLSGMTGSASGSNGTYVITTVADVVDGLDAGNISNATTSYIWTKGSYTITKNKYQWELKNGTTTIARTYGDEVDHPELASGWVFLSGSGTPTFSFSRTGGIERVRKAQKDFALENPGAVFFYDSRGAIRGDGVHMTLAGQTTLSYRFRSALVEQVYPSLPTVNTTNIVGNLKIEGDGYNAAVVQGNLQLGAIDGTATSTLNANYGTTTGMLTVYAEINPATGLSATSSTSTDPEFQVARSAVASLGSYGSLNVVGPLANDNITGASAAASTLDNPSAIEVTNASTAALNGTYTKILDGIYSNGNRFVKYQSGSMSFFMIQDAAANNIGNTVSLPSVGAMLSVVSTAVSAPYWSPGSSSGSGSVPASLLVPVVTTMVPANTSTPTTPTVSGITSASFPRSLTQGAKGDDVKKLQQYLNAKGFAVALTGVGSKGKETNLFGPATRAALIRFQKANKITPAVGFFGPVTRAAIK